MFLSSCVSYFRSRLFCHRLLIFLFIHLVFFFLYFFSVQLLSFILSYLFFLSYPFFSRFLITSFIHFWSVFQNCYIPRNNIMAPRVVEWLASLSSKTLRMSSSLIGCLIHTALWHIEIKSSVNYNSQQYRYKMVTMQKRVMKKFRNN